MDLGPIIVCLIHALHALELRGYSRVNDCHDCDGTGLVWDTSSDSIYQGEEKQQASPGGSSPESSSLSSYDRQG
ncbi:hypothetical protein F4815DRAFT_456145 [Daldinia loculata]|nr:hypothetical protein F4815DRAFT_456145 [Daldinia loculata]